MRARLPGPRAAAEALRAYLLSEKGGGMHGTGLSHFYHRHPAHAGAELRPAGRAEEYELRMAPQRPELPGALPSALGAEVAMHPHSEALARAADAVEGEVRQAEAERAKASAAEPRLGTEPNLADLLGVKPLGE